MFPRLQWRGVRLGRAHLLLFSSPTRAEARNQRTRSISPQMQPAPFTHYHWWIIEDSPRPPRDSCPLCMHTHTVALRKHTGEEAKAEQIKFNLRCQKCILSLTSFGQGTTTSGSGVSNRRDIRCWSTLFSMFSSQRTTKKSKSFSPLSENKGLSERWKRKQQSAKFWL